MINEKILIALNEADDAFIAESVPGIEGVSAAASRRRSKRLTAVIIAAALILACGAAAFASGILTAPFSIYRSKDAEVKHRTMTVNGVEVDFIDIDVQVPQISQSEVRGALRTDLEAFMQKTMEFGGPTADWVNLGEEGIYGRADGYHYEVWLNKEFDDQQKALDYIGLKKYEIQYFPYENYKAAVSTACHATADSGSGFSGMDIGFCWYYVESLDEKISVELRAECSLINRKPKKGEICNMGMGGFPDDGSMAVETFTNSHGYNCAKAYASDGSAEKYGIIGLVVKNNVLYSSSISCDWADKEEADQIFRNWAEHF